VNRTHLQGLALFAPGRGVGLRGLGGARHVAREARLGLAQPRALALQLGLPALRRVAQARLRRHLIHRMKDRRYGE
jgi:hypothetical protein